MGPVQWFLIAWFAASGIGGALWIASCVLWPGPPPPPRPKPRRETAGWRPKGRPPPKPYPPPGQTIHGPGRGGKRGVMISSEDVKDVMEGCELTHDALASLLRRHEEDRYNDTRFIDNEVRQSLNELRRASMRLAMVAVVMQRAESGGCLARRGVLTGRKLEQKMRGVLAKGPSEESESEPNEAEDK